MPQWLSCDVQLVHLRLQREASQFLILDHPRGQITERWNECKRLKRTEKGRHFSISFFLFIWHIGVDSLYMNMSNGLKKRGRKFFVLFSRCKYFPVNFQSEWNHLFLTKIFSACIHNKKYRKDWSSLERRDWKWFSVAIYPMQLPHLLFSFSLALRTTFLVGMAWHVFCYFHCSSARAAPILWYITHEHHIKSFYL